MEGYIKHTLCGTTDARYRDRAKTARMQPHNYAARMRESVAGLLFST